MTLTVSSVVAGMARLTTIPLFAEALSTGESNPWRMFVPHLAAAVIFALIGIIVLAISMWLFVKLSPFCVRKEIEEDQNTALAIIMGSVLLGLSLIIAAAIIG